MVYKDYNIQSRIFVEDLSDVCKEETWQELNIIPYDGMMVYVHEKESFYILCDAANLTIPESWAALSMKIDNEWEEPDFSEPLTVWKENRNPDERLLQSHYEALYELLMESRITHIIFLMVGLYFIFITSFVVKDELYLCLSIAFSVMVWLSKDAADKHYEKRIEELEEQRRKMRK